MQLGLRQGLSHAVLFAGRKQHETILLGLGRVFPPRWDVLIGVLAKDVLVAVGHHDVANDARPLGNNPSFLGDKISPANAGRSAGAHRIQAHRFLDGHRQGVRFSPLVDTTRAHRGDLVPHFFLFVLIPGELQQRERQRIGRRLCNNPIRCDAICLERVREKEYELASDNWYMYIIQPYKVISE